MQVFVLGTGRSGTHWVGCILGDHPDVRATIEGTQAFKVATEAAVAPSKQNRLLPVLRVLYMIEIVRSKPRHYADKSHPVIWYADEVARWFPQAKFVAIERSPFGTVASMLQHSEVRSRQEGWERYELPSPFLGIDESNVSSYAGMSPAERAALRWLSHHQQLIRLRDELGDRLLVLDYETMVDQYEREHARLWTFLGLPRPPVTRRPHTASRDAWQEQLSADDVESIARITGVGPEDVLTNPA